MPAGKRYCFDFRDENAFAPDEEGLGLPDIESVQEEAARALAQIATDVVAGAPRSGGRPMAIEVRDETGPVLKLEFSFKADRRE